MWYHQLLSGYLVNDHLVRVSRHLRLLANDKGDNKPSICVCVSMCGLEKTTILQGIGL